MCDTDIKKITQSWTEILDAGIPFWSKWYQISQFQKDIASNYMKMCFNLNGFKPFASVAPNNLWQAINPMSFSLVEFTKEIKGSTELEAKILTDVAGYGSQLGTILDFLEVLENTAQIDFKKLKEEEAYKYLKFKNLLGDINKVKRD